MKKYVITFCLILSAMTAWSQGRVIAGQIMGSQQDTLIGVVVVQKGTSNATTTDVDGKFALQVADSGAVQLVISYVGFKEQIVTVAGGQTEIFVAMQEDVMADEVVVVGYGTVKKSDLTGAVTSLKPDDVKQVPSGNVVEAIQGKAPGVDVVRTSGEAGKAPNITVRGNRSISAGNGPLYIVDGVQYSSIQDINPNDIQSMEVLKDASSTAIYGSRGANGVIIVTTKRGASGDLRVFVNAYTGFSKTLAYPRAMNGQEWADLRLEAYKTQNPTLPATYAAALGGDDYTNYANGVYTDYTDEVLKDRGAQSNLQVGVSGGSDKVKSYFSLDYYNEKGLLRNDELDRYTGRLNLDLQLSKFLKIGTQSQVTYYDQSKRANPLGNAAKINPLTRPFNDDGSIIVIPGGKHANPLIDEQPNTAVDERKAIRIFPTIYAEITPLKGLTARTNLALNWDNRSDGAFNAASSYSRLNSGAVTSQAIHEAQYRQQLNWQGIINYNKTIKEDHSVGVTALSEIITNKTERFYVEANDQLIPEQLYFNLGENLSRVTSSRYIKSSLVSFAGRLNYSYKSKYLLTVTGRSDGASVLAEGNKWDFFPSVAGGWRLSEEAFMDFQKFFSTIKVRGSWGIAGNANIEPYSTQSTLMRIPFAYDETGVTAYTFRPQIGNTGTKWEKSKTVDVGLDLGMMKERITLTLDYYNTHTNDLLLTQKLPLTSGVVQTVANVGKTRNQGIEVALNSINIDETNFRWSSTLTFMKNKETVLELAEGVNNMQVTTLDEENQMTKTVVVGHPVNSFYDYEKIGIWQSHEADEASKYSAVPGMIRIKDQNGDGAITTDDRVVVGSSVPKWSAGFNSEFRFRNFDVSFFLYSRYGQTINYQYTYSPSGAENSLSTREYWTPENPTNDLPRPGLSIPSQFLRTINYTDGSFLKLRSVVIGYTLPEKISKVLGMSRCRVYLSGKNLLVLSKIKDYDPEMEGSLTFPTVRLFVGGVNIEF